MTCQPCAQAAADPRVLSFAVGCRACTLRALAYGATQLQDRHLAHLFAPRELPAARAAVEQWRQRMAAAGPEERP